jgi:hypothetical protein
VRDTGRVSWQCTHRSHGVDGHHSGHVVDGLCAFMKQLARAGALKSQSGRSKRGALVGREFIPGVLIRRGPSQSIRSTASVIAHTLTCATVFQAHVREDMDFRVTPMGL